MVACRCLCWSVNWFQLWKMCSNMSMQTSSKRLVSLNFASRHGRSQKRKWEREVERVRETDEEHGRFMQSRSALRSRCLDLYAKRPLWFQDFILGRQKGNGVLISTGRKDGFHRSSHLLPRSEEWQELSTHVRPQAGDEVALTFTT